MPCAFLICTAMVVRSCSTMVDRPTKSYGDMCTCSGELAVAVLGKGCIRLLMRVDSIILPSTTSPVTDTRCAEKQRRLHC